MDSSIKPLGINIKQNDRDVLDGFLQESINLQWRDGSFKPIPKRILTDINTTLYGRIILHKVGDEDVINVLGFTRTIAGYLAEDLSAYLGGGEDTLNGELNWFGVITDGVYVAKDTPQILSVVRTAGMSWTNLNGLLYFMGDGNGDDERYYLRLQFNETSSLYEEKDMYAWKSLIPFYPKQKNITVLAPKSNWQVISQCGFCLIRFTLVLKTGEEVLHSPIYLSYLYGLNRSDDTMTDLDEELAIENIHSIVNLNLQFADMDLFSEEISSVNIYCSAPYWESEIPKNSIPTYTLDEHYGTLFILSADDIKGEVQNNAEQPFYLVKTIESSSSEYADQLILSVGSLDSDLEFKYYDDSDVEYSKVDIKTIAAGETMPVDNFSYHKKYGSITSYNGRLVIERPTTVLSDGHIRSLALSDTESYSRFKMETEDGNIDKLSDVLDKSIDIDLIVYAYKCYCRGILSYPDYRVGVIGVNGMVTEGDTYNVYNYKSRKNKYHNMACVFDLFIANINSILFIESGDNAKFTAKYYGTIGYYNTDLFSFSNPSTIISIDKYTSENAVQFSEIGEYSVWPASDSTRVGDGKVMKVGSNNVDQKSANMVSMLLVGTTDGLWSINTDPTGNNFISSVTRISRTPYLSKEVLQIGNSFIFVGDEGLMVTENGGEPKSLSYDFFPGQGDGILPTNTNDVLPNYLTLTDPYFDGDNPYLLLDIVNYLKGAKLAYNNKRKSIWCSNPDEDFSLIYDIENKAWGMSSTVFAESIELFGTMATDDLDVNSWYLVMDNNSLQPYLLILSGEDMETEVFVHLLTRPLKMKSGNNYKKLSRMFARCELFRNELDETGYFAFGLWGKQDINKYKVNIPIDALLDGTTDTFPDGIRQDVPIGYRKGKYKALSVLLGGLVLPDSSIDSFEFDTSIVEDNLMR